MKYKKYSYILVLMLMLIVGINKTYAATEKVCYYISPEGADKELKVQATIKWDYAAKMEKITSTVIVNKFDKTLSTSEVPLLNWSDHYTMGSNKDSIWGWFAGSNNETTSGIKFEYLNNLEKLKKMTDAPCPNYIVIEYSTSWGKEYFAWGTNSELLAEKALKSKKPSATYAYASNKKNGRQITKEMYIETFESAYGDKQELLDPTQLTCEGIFTSDIKDMISTALKYPRIIVPILLILFGTLDFAKAVISSKEDEMKKAQSKFIRRLIAGVAVFLVPVFIDVIISFSNLVWEGMGYEMCNFK